MRELEDVPGRHWTPGPWIKGATLTEAALNTTSVKHPARESAGPRVLDGLGSWTIVWALALNLFLGGPLLAIPSPDVVIGIFASVGQILGLLAVSAGGILFAHKRRRNHLAGENAGLKTGVPSWALKILLALFVVSITANILQYCRTVSYTHLTLPTICSV